MRPLSADEAERFVRADPPHRIRIDKLVELANRVLDERIGLSGQFAGDDDKRALEDILRVGTSAGGARPKAVIAMNDQGHILSGQTGAPAGYDY